MNDVKVNEGMTESIPKNKNKDSDKLVKALLSSDIDFIHDKYNTRLLSDTVVVMEAMFNSLIYAFKRTYKNNYDSVVKEIANSCVNYGISLTEDDFVITFDFGGARECNRIEKFLFDKMGVGYCYIWKDGKSKIKLS